MSKKHSDNKEAHYKAIIQKQKRIIQDLKKKIGRVDKLEKRYADLEDRETELEFEVYVQKSVFIKNECPSCNSELNIIDGGRRKIIVCNNCGYRTSKKA